MVDAVAEDVITLDHARKWRNIGLLSIAELLAMTLWFSASAVVPQLTKEWNLTGSQQSWVTMSVQLGFVAGALLSAVFNLADRIQGRLFFGISAFVGAALNAAIPLFDPGIAVAIVLRFLTGVSLAGVYPPGMKLIATWCKKDRGLGIGILVGALTVGSAGPHLVNGLSIFGEAGMPDWTIVLYASSVQAVVAGLLVMTAFQPGPFLAAAHKFNWRFAGRSLTERASRLANFGYFGHMWEIYAMWTWTPIFLIKAYESAGWSLKAARLAGFSVIAIGAIGCVVAGKLADSIGRTTITIWSLVISGTCALIVGLFFGSPALLTAICLIWGIAAVADSAQFSAAISELSDPRYVGTALTVQTSVGFLLTLFSIHIIPALVGELGWDYVFMILAIGPAFSILSMARLRSLPEATRMASGRK